MITESNKIFINSTVKLTKIVQIVRKGIYLCIMNKDAYAHILFKTRFNK